VSASRAAVASHPGPPPVRLADADWDEARAASHRLGEELRSTSPIGTELVPIARAGGRTLAADLQSPCDLPRFASSAMDGWAVAPRSDRTAGWVVGVPLLAGDLPADRALERGEARPIATGAPVPPGTFAILRSEHGDVVGGELRISPLAPAGTPRANAEIRPAGEEARRGDVLIPASATLTAPRIALAASAGYDDFTVEARSSVDLLLLGDEVMSHGAPGPGKVRDALGPVLPALIESLGLETSSTRRIGDDRDEVRRALEHATSPLVVTTGGSSRGPADFVRSALTALRARCMVDGVAMRPGHPVMLWRLPDGRAVLCLPGNPLAALVCWASFGPALAAGLAGRPLPRLGRATLGVGIPARGRATRLLVCADDDELRSLPWQGSGMLRGLAEADVLAVIPPEGASAGQTVRTLSLR
jgi:molybdopterin molybdotransferase